MARIKRFGGMYMAMIDGKYIKEMSGHILYEIDGFITHEELCALIALLYV